MLTALLAAVASAGGFVRLFAWPGFSGGLAGGGLARFVPLDAPLFEQRARLVAYCRFEQLSFFGVDAFPVQRRKRRAMRNVENHHLPFQAEAADRRNRIVDGEAANACDQR